MGNFKQYIAGQSQPSDRGEYLVLLENGEGKRRFEIDMWYHDWTEWSNNRVSENHYRVLAWSDLPSKDVQFE